MVERFRASSLVVAGLALLSLSGCGEIAPVAVTPSLLQISGFGKWIKAGATWPDTFNFAVRPGEYCGPPTQCEQKFPDTAFVDFAVPAKTSFEVIADGVTLTRVGDAAPVGDYQYRRASLDDGSGAQVAYRIAVGIPQLLKNPDRAREWCGPTTFKLEIVGTSNHQTSGRSAPLPVSFVWGRCPSTHPPGVWYATAKAGTPRQTNPPTPTGDCAGGAFAKSFDVCERCGTTGLPVEKTLWGCDLNEARANMGMPGCTYQLRSGINCP